MHRPVMRPVCRSAFVLMVCGLTLVDVPRPLAADQAKATLGKQIFTTKSTPRCGICHTLADAGTKGKIGPNLDKLKRTEEQIRKAVRGGIGAMPPYGSSLSEEEIAAVAHYVATASPDGK